MMSYGLWQKFCALQVNKTLPYLVSNVIELLAMLCESSICPLPISLIPRAGKKWVWLARSFWKTSGSDTHRKTLLFLVVRVLCETLLYIFYRFVFQQVGLQWLLCLDPTE